MGNFGISATLLVPHWINRRNRCRQYIGNQLWKARQYFWSQRWFDVGPTLVAEVGCRCRPLVNGRYHADVGQRRFPMMPRHLPTSGRRRPDLHLLPGIWKQKSLASFHEENFWSILWAHNSVITQFRGRRDTQTMSHRLIEPRRESFLTPECAEREMRTVKAGKGTQWQWIGKDQAAWHPNNTEKYDYVFLK